MQALEYPFDGEALLRKKRALRRELAAQPGLVEKKVAIVSGTTVGEVKNMLELFLLNSGIRPAFWEGPYGLYYESIAFDDGSLAAFAPDVIYIHTSVHNLQTCPARQTAPGPPKKNLPPRPRAGKGCGRRRRALAAPWCRTTSSCRTCACWAALTLWLHRGACALCAA